MAPSDSIVSNKRETYLVIGANGFVGSHLVDQLVNLTNVQVLCFDRFSRPPVFMQRPNTKLIKGDFFNKQDLEKVLEDVDYVVHCFSATTPASSLANPGLNTQMIKRNTEFFENCAKNNIKKIAFVSSADVYGKASEKQAATEDDKPRPTSPYGKAKLASERSLEALRVKYGQAYVAYRLTNPYGPRQIFKNGAGVIPVFIDNIMAGRKISVFGDGSASRDFIYVEDAARMMVDALTQPDNHSLYNIGSGKQTTLNDLIGELQNHFSGKIDIDYKETPAINSKRIWVSITRFSSEFGVPELMPLEAGIAKTLATAKPKTAVEK
jgi:UDP-glucose 4-epimerase